MKFNCSYKPSEQGFIWNCQHNPKFSNANDTAIIKEIKNYGRGFPGDAAVKKTPAKAGDSIGAGSIPGPGRSPHVEMATDSILAWKIPWIKEPGGLQSMGWQRVEYD